uniref:hypothetical protein n=1 Tax=Enterocloster clostridioformis TaxID=1531 RepID=UPI0026ED1F98|nr:hypothetical protein [Enterocloster clostridioformis]
MENREGLVLQGCGGDLQEWVDGINQLLTEEGILQDGDRLEDVACFQNGGLTNLVFFFGEEKLDVGKLAVWRLRTHPQFEGKWLSDYVNNRLGGFGHHAAGQEKPECPLIGENGNIFHLIGVASRTLRDNGLAGQAQEMQKRITGGDCHSYEEALSIIGEYVTITAGEEQETGMEMRM